MRGFSGKVSTAPAQSRSVINDGGAGAAQEKTTQQGGCEVWELLEHTLHPEKMGKQNLLPRRYKLRVFGFFFFFCSCEISIRQILGIEQVMFLE